MRFVKLLNFFISSRLKRAFSLVELSIILTAGSIFVVGGIYLSEFSENEDKYLATENKIELIETALLAYYKKNGFFPCPADPSLNIKLRDAGDSLDINGNNSECDISIISSDGYFYVGAVPTNELGLSYEYMLDAWGNKLSIVIPKVIYDAQVTANQAFYSTPSNYSNLLFWLDANDSSLITKDASNFVSRIEDKGDNNYDFIQNTSSYRPQYILDGNYPAIKFDGSNDRLFINTKYYNGYHQIPYLTAFVVYKTSSGNKQIFVSYDGGEYWRSAMDSNNRFEFKTGDPNLYLYYSSSGYRDGNIHIYTVRYSKDEQNKSIYLDGVLKASNTTSLLSGGLGSGMVRYGYIGVGSEAGSAGGAVNAASSYVLGNIYEVVVYEKAFTSGELSAMHDYLNNKWKNGYAYLGVSVSDSGYMSIKDVDSSLIENEGIFAIISFGPSGNGAYAKSGVKDSNLPTYNNLESGFDSQSITTDYKFIDSVLTKYKGFNESFDQIVRYANLDDLARFDN